METWDNEIGIKKESYSTKHCSVVSQSTSLVREAPLEKPSVSLEYMQIDSHTVTSPQASIKDLSIYLYPIISSIFHRISHLSIKSEIYLSSALKFASVPSYLHPNCF